LSSYAQYVCEPNYKLEGFERRMCLENGSWSGSPPNCKGISITITRHSRFSQCNLNDKSSLI
jgi:hypothetical protein